jgi:sterol desaturase/sphingolipid hydroxylase (fatty acid hydroxylase superfamily)
LFIESLYQHEGGLKWALLLLAFVIFALWETYRPRRVPVASTARRWGSHALVSYLCNTSAAWIFPASAVMVASTVGASRYGVLNRAAVPFGIRFVLAVLLLDLARYGQHYLHHAVPILWRVHQVHHSDPDYDWSTSQRFHPVEVLVTQGTQLAVIALLAPPALAVLCLEALQGVVNIFAHANVAVPGWIDARLRVLLLTPDMHRIHHSDDISDQNTNFGVVFPWWDRLFGTYRQEPAAGYDNMGVGLREVDVKEGASLLRMLAQPFRSPSRISEVACAPTPNRADA